MFPMRKRLREEDEEAYSHNTADAHKVRHPRRPRSFAMLRSIRNRERSPSAPPQLPDITRFPPKLFPLPRQGQMQLPI